MSHPKARDTLPDILNVQDIVPDIRFYFQTFKIGLFFHFFILNVQNVRKSITSLWMTHHGMTNKLFTGRKAPFTFRAPVDNTCKVSQAFHFPWIEIILHLDKLIFKSLKIRRIRTIVSSSL